MRSLEGRLAQLKMEEVLLEREVKRAHEGVTRYRVILEESLALLDDCRVALVNVESSLDGSRIPH